MDQELGAPTYLSLSLCVRRTELPTTRLARITGEGNAAVATGARVGNAYCLGVILGNNLKTR